MLLMEAYRRKHGVREVVSERVLEDSWLVGGGRGLVCSYFCGVGGKKFDGGSKAKPGLI